MNEWGSALRRHAITGGPNVKLGTKCPSMISMCCWSNGTENKHMHAKFHESNVSIDNFTYSPTKSHPNVDGMTTSTSYHYCETKNIARTLVNLQTNGRTNQSAPISNICCASSANLDKSHDSSDGAMSEGQLCFIIVQIFLRRERC